MHYENGATEVIILDTSSNACFTKNMDALNRDFLHLSYMLQLRYLYKQVQLGVNSVL